MALYQSERCMSRKRAARKPAPDGSRLLSRTSRNYSPASVTSRYLVLNHQRLSCCCSRLSCHRNSRQHIRQGHSLHNCNLCIHRHRSHSSRSEQHQRNPSSRHCLCRSIPPNRNIRRCTGSRLECIRYIRSLCIHILHHSNRNRSYPLQHSGRTGLPSWPAERLQTSSSLETRISWKSLSLSLIRAHSA